jgi:O-antigen ligase
MLSLILFAFSRRHRRAAFGLMALGALIAAGVLIFSPYGEDLSGRFASFLELGQDVSGQVRRHLILSGLNIFADGPNFIWGAGHESFPAALESHLYYLMSHDVYYHAGIRAGHNLWITVAAELGLLGLAAITVFFWAVYRTLSLLMKGQGPGLQRSLSVALLVYVTVKIVDFNFNPEFGENLFWYAMGLLGALGAMAEPKVHA